jgi:hypothetical protein
LPPKKAAEKSPVNLPPKNEYLPPTTQAPAPVQPAAFIYKSYIEPGFTFGEFPLSLVPIVEAKKASDSEAQVQGGYN